MTSIRFGLIALALVLGSPTAVAAPNNFSVVIGSALVCRDQASSDYFNAYMQTHFGKPAFDAGGANWWKVTENLFGSSTEYVFVGRGLDFIGATFKETPDALIENVKGATGIEYKLASRERWVAPTSGVLIRYYDRNTPSKMYCVGYPHTPN
jgi:hypothetical protein